MKFADDGWASLLPDLLLDIFRRLESTTVIRCTGACKPWRRAIIGNTSSLRPRPDRYNPNLLLGFFHHSCSQGEISLTAVDTGGCESLSSFIPAASAGGDLSMSHYILTSRDGFLLLHRCRNSQRDGLCLCNPMSGDCTFLPLAPFKQNCTYVLLNRDDDLRTVRVLAIAAGTSTSMLCTEDDRLAYQVFSCGDDGTVVWGPVQRCEVNKALRMVHYGSKMEACRDAVYWLGETQDIDGCHTEWTVGLDVYTGRAWTVELPTERKFYFTSYALTTSGNDRPSLLQLLPENNIRVWVLDGDDVSGMECTVQYNIRIDKQTYPDAVVCLLSIKAFNFWNVVCPRSGLLFTMLPNKPQLRIELDSGACQPVLNMGKRSQRLYYPYEMDWSTYISNMNYF